MKDDFTVPNGNDEEMPFQYFEKDIKDVVKDYVSGIDPCNTEDDGSKAFYLKWKSTDKSGKVIAQYFGRPDDGIPFPNLIDKLKYYNASVIKEKTDEDYRMELKAIAMFKPEVFKEFLKNDYERIINKEYGTRTK